MKNKGVKLVLIILFAGLFAINSNAQSINVGGGLLLATDRPNVGVKIQGNYGMDFLLENLSLSADFAIFFPNKRDVLGVETKTTRWAIDFDGHYKFFEASGFKFYAIGGLNISHVSVKTEDVTSTFFGVTTTTPGTTSSSTKPGLNVGAGANYNFSSKMKAFTEFKYILSNYDQAEISLGVLFEL